jgi:lipid-A-disaccharide synthase
MLRRAGVPVLYYVAPQLWAWRPGRISRLSRAVDRLAVILPFEADWFGSRGIESRFVGHPLLDHFRPDHAQAREALHLPLEGRVLGIFPGSRAEEIKRHWPLFRAVAHQMMAEGRCTSAIVAGTADGAYPDGEGIRVVRGKAAEVMAATTAALVKSGTTTLEAALAGTPMVVAYRSTWSTHTIARRVMTVDRISLVNLVAGQDIVPEFWRRPLRATEMADAVSPLLDPATAEHAAQQAGLAVVRERLGTPGAAGRVADMAEALVLA